MRQFFEKRYVLGDGLEAPELKGPDWPRIAARYRRIHVVPLEYLAPNYFRLGLFAAEHGMSINVGYFSRVGDVGTERDALLARLRNANWEPATVYVLNDPALLDEIPRGPGDAVLESDGMLVLAPGFREPDGQLK